MKSAPAETRLKEQSVLLEIKWLVDLAFYSGLPMLVLFAFIGYIANSATILTAAAAFILGLIVRYFAFRSMKIICKSDILRFPYGSGKLENFSSLLYGALAIPSSLGLIYLSVRRIITPVTTIQFSIAQIPVLLSLARNLYLVYIASKLRKKTDSPMVESYKINYTVASFFDTGVLISLTASILLIKAGNIILPAYLDATLSLLISCYALIVGTRLTIKNFRVLIDLPLCEEDQLKILKVLAAEYDRYESVGNIYTRRSGSDRFVDIELFVNENIRMAEIDVLRIDMTQRLEAQFGIIKFNLIPLKWQEGEKTIV